MRNDFETAYGLMIIRFSVSLKVMGQFLRKSSPNNFNLKLLKLLRISKVYRIGLKRYRG